MTARNADVDAGDRREPDPATIENDSVVVFEFAVPTEHFVLAKPLEEFPDMVVETERIVPTNHQPMPYLWASGQHSPRFTDSLVADEKVEGATLVATFDDGALYRMEWEVVDGELLDWISASHEDIVLLEAHGRHDGWILTLRFPARSMLADFRAFYEELDIDVRVLRLYDLAEPKLGRYGLSKKQREALVVALELGYFEIPKEAALDTVAEALGISSKATSERIRRGMTNLISNSLAVGRPVGMGLPHL